MHGLVDKKDVGASIPAPISSDCSQPVFAKLDNLTRPDLLEKANHARATWPTIDEDGERCAFGQLSGFNEPEEGIDSHVACVEPRCSRRQRDVARILLLCEDCRAGP